MTPDLLPAGLRDRLPDEAGSRETRARAMLDAITARGFALVAPPLAEYEEGLAARLTSRRTDLARFVDPQSQRMLAIRSDITPQVARIATTRLAHEPRPLRLAYAGPVLKLAADPLDPAREAVQIGAELIGDDSVEAACEIAAVAIAALAAAGAGAISVDLTLPDLVETLTGRILPPERIARLDNLLDMKDAGALAAEGFADWLPLLGAMGPVAPALDALRAFDHAGLMTSRIDGVARIAGALAEAGVAVTLDPTERHGFEYQKWFGFSLFVPGRPRAIGRGGAYAIARLDGTPEAATGFSIYPDALAGQA